MTDKHFARGYAFVYALIFFTALIYELLPFSLPAMGDDLAYSSGYGEYYEGSIMYYPRWVLRHWMYTNGRLPNLGAPLFLYFLPLWVSNLLNGLMVILLLYLVLKCAGIWRRYTTLSIAVIAVLVLGLQWWDGFMLRIVMANYVLPSVMALGFILLFFSGREPHRPLARIAVCVFSLAAGMGHEAATTTLAAGVVVYFLIRWHSPKAAWREFSSIKRCMAVCFIAGMLVNILSPALWTRLGNGEQPDDSMPWLVVRSCYLVLVMLAGVICMLIFRRRALSRLLQTQFTVFAVAAVCGCGVVAAGGIVGRSGFFSQIYAVIAIVMMATEAVDIRINKACAIFLSTLLWLVVSVHLTALALWQFHMAKEASEVIGLYEDSRDGTVFYDYTRYDRVPWYLLGKTSGVPDEDDFYELETINRWYGDSVKTLVVLPKAPAHEKGCYTTDLPTGASDTIPGSRGRRFFSKNGIEMIAVPLNDGSGYYVVPRVRHPANKR